MGKTIGTRDTVTTTGDIKVKQQQAAKDIWYRGIGGDLKRITPQDPMEKAQEEWNTIWEPQWNKYGGQLQREAQTAYDRSLAEAQGRLGYGLSMSGSGEGGLAEASRLALTTEAQNKRMDIASMRAKALQEAYLQFMTTKDTQAFELAKLAATYEYNKKMAEMNQPSWWESVGQIIGTGLGIALAWPTGGLSLAGGAIVGGGVGQSMGTWLGGGK